MSKPEITKEIEQRLKYECPERLAAMLEESTLPWLAVLLKAAAKIRRHKAAKISKHSEPMGQALADTAEPLAAAAEALFRRCSPRIRDEYADQAQFYADEWLDQNPHWPSRGEAETPTDGETE